MNFEFAEKINAELETLDFPNALAIAETELQKIPLTAFHTVLGQSLVDQAGDLLIWIDNFYQVASKKQDIKAL